MDRITHVEQVRILKSWNVPSDIDIQDIKTDPAVISWLTAWMQKPKPKNILITEPAGNLQAPAAADLAAWAICGRTGYNMIISYVYRINGILLWTGDQQTLDQQVIGKIKSCDLLWVEELAGGKLTEHQRTLLHSVIIGIKNGNIKTVISVSTSIDQLSEWVGEVISKILVRNFDIIQT